jgi:hypothetical protein
MVGKTTVRNIQTCSRIASLHESVDESWIKEIFRVDVPAKRVSLSIPYQKKRGFY